MKRPIAISLSPNTEPDDVTIAWRSLWHFSSWRDISVIPNIEQQIAQIFVVDRWREGNNLPQAALVSSGRSGMYRTLQALGIGQVNPSTSSRQDEVIVQAFTCLAVPISVKWSGAKPVFADVIEATYNLDPQDVAKKITPQTKAIIVQHTFGIPADMAALKKLASERNIVLIEDLAHGLGGRLDGTPLGLHGDVAVLSFGRDKTISSIFGGAIVSCNAALIKEIRAQQEQLPLPPAWWSKQQLLHPIVMSGVVPLYFTAGLGKGLLVLSQKISLLSKAVTNREKTGAKPPYIDWRFSPALAAVLKNQLAKLPKFTEHRRRVAYRYHEAGFLDGKLSSYLDDAAWLRVPYRVVAAELALQTLRDRKMLLGDWYLAPVTPRDVDATSVSGYISGSCPIAEKLSRTTIDLPTYPLLHAQDIEQVIAAVKSLP